MLGGAHDIYKQKGGLPLSPLPNLPLDKIKLNLHHIPTYKDIIIIINNILTNLLDFELLLNIKTENLIQNLYTKDFKYPHSNLKNNPQIILLESFEKEISDKIRIYIFR